MGAYAYVLPAPGCFERLGELFPQTLRGSVNYILCRSYSHNFLISDIYIISTAEPRFNEWHRSSQLGSLIQIFLTIDTFS